MSTELLEKRTKLLERKTSELEARLRKLEQDLKEKSKPKIGMSLAEVKAEILKPPIKRTEKDIERALSIVGIWKGGPKDLAENFRDYLRGNKKWK